jgi:formylglycine-generating enzyme required for sulfatase activity
MRTLGKYELLDELGEENFTTIFRARDTQVNSEVTLRVLPALDTQPPELAKYFKKNAKAATELSHPHIATVCELGEDEGTLYLAMQHESGRTLRQFLDQHERLTLRRALPILTQLAEALDYVHEQGVVYLSLDPAGVILESEDEPPSVIITDLGTTKEQVTEQEQEISAHVFALAALAFEMLLGRPPVNGELATHAEISSDESLYSFLQSIPRLLEDDAANSHPELAIFPAGLYSTAGEMVAAMSAENDRLIADDWQKVESLASRVARDDRSQTEALAIIAEAAAAMYRKKTIEDTRQQLAKLYKQGEQAVQEKNWEGAVSAFENVASIDPSYHEVQEKLALATSERQLARLFDQATFQVRAGELAQACRSWLALLKEQRDYRSGLAMLHFIDTVQGLLDQLDRSGKEQLDGSDESKEPNLLTRDEETEMSVANELNQPTSSPTKRLNGAPRQESGTEGNNPTDSFLTADELDQLLSSSLEEPDVVLGQESVTAEENTMDSFLTADELEQLESLPLEEPDPLLGQEPGTEGNLHEDSFLTADQLNNLASSPTKQFEEAPEKKPEMLGKTTKDPVLTADKLNQLASSPTKQLEEVPGQELGMADMTSMDSLLTADELNQLATAPTELLVTNPDAKKVQQVQQPQSDRKLWRVDGKEMVRIQSGEFLYSSETKLVFLDEFWIDKTPVTNAEYKRFLEANPRHPVPFSDRAEAKPHCWDRETCNYPEGMGDHPVVLVSLEDVQAYAMWAGKRLATEQEWEKAARGLDGRTYPWGDNWREQACNTLDMGIGSTTPIGKFTPAGDSPFGCVDMSGNVWEWTSTENENSNMVLRGGSWGNEQKDVKCIGRSHSKADVLSIFTGFRLVLTTIIPD